MFTSGISCLPDLRLRHIIGMPDRGLKGAKAPSQVSKVSRQAITLGNLQSTDKTYEVCL